MLGKKTNLVLTYAVSEELFLSPTFLRFLETFREVDDADLVIISPDELEDERFDNVMGHMIDVGGIIYSTDAQPQDVYRDRHLAYWSYLNDHGHRYQNVLCTDCRDVVFQSSPFKWAEGWKKRFDSIHGQKNFLDHFVILTAEGFKMPASGFACIDHFEFQRYMSSDCKMETDGRWVVNGGISLGTSRAMQDFHFLVWAVTARAATTCTDQATVNWLMKHLNEDESYSISFPMHDNLCLTGEGVKEKCVMPIVKDGKYFNPKGDMYCLIHQWDRIPDFGKS